MRSIKRYLLWTITLALLLGAGLAITAAYFTSQHEMDEMFDAELAKFARIIAGLNDTTLNEQHYQALARRLDQPDHPGRYFSDDGVAAPIDDRADQAVRYFHEERMISVGFWGPNGTPRVLDGEWHDNGAFPAPTETGFRWQTYDEQDWRVFSMRLGEGRGWISVGLRKAFEQELAGKIALSNTIPYLIAIPLLALIIGALVLRGLRPLDRLSSQVGRRHHKALDPINEDVPLELVPLRDAINAFIAHLKTTLERERRFTSDAAHELRTPLASLKIHLQNARTDPVGEKASLGKAYQGIERLQRVVEQLLTLARLERSSAPTREHVALYPLAAQLSSELWPVAETRGQQLAIEGDTALKVCGEATELGVLIRNLLDNALRYSPEGAVIMLVLKTVDDEPTLEVIDEGPGVPEENLDRLTERFYRQNHQHMAGTGLGLSIVNTLALRQNARLSFINRPEGGLIARVSWPPFADSAPAGTE
ncbi:ATP-binding protein [Larsenimonas suaedae]|uniref:histidine kinase n=1 Tax=Larsenimonas suaedae TaxID=1851019 RepID=A0ABU1GZ47_9GAMM|nr:ATP-binding protein [Larsenimonas suaedae]MCM2971456.1 ATP-binding protein [Larsenimonas suaedae]MDR5896712.1 ATP-binding protein [Larsenimonas suaedae]